MKEVKTIEVRQFQQISNVEEKAQLWQVYKEAFRIVNLKTPCRQNYREKEFLCLLEDPEVTKFVLLVNEQPAGIGLITNRLEKVEWVNPEFFAKSFPELVRQGLLYYLIGIAVKPNFTKLGLGGKLLTELIESLPPSGAVAFDYSDKVNKGIPLFAKKSLPHKIEGKELDKQIYCIYRYADK